MQQTTWCSSTPLPHYLQLEVCSQMFPYHHLCRWESQATKWQALWLQVCLLLLEAATLTPSLDRSSFIIGLYFQVEVSSSVSAVIRTTSISAKVWSSKKRARSTHSSTLAPALQEIPRSASTTWMSYSYIRTSQQVLFRPYSILKAFKVWRVLHSQE